MLSAELDYHLPPELIAQQPVEPRHSARLLGLKRGVLPLETAISHTTIAHLSTLLRPDDLLIFNDTRVLRARLRGFKVSGGRVEALLLREVEANVWEAMLKPSARLKPESALRFESADGAHQIMARPIERLGASWLLRFEGQDVRQLLPHLGEVPLPPYIAPPAELSDGEIEARYQTVYAREDHDFAGAALDSAAAPTAGLHFSPELLQALETRGIRHAFVTLGVGAGTFRPIQTERVEEHSMHREEFEIPSQTARLIAKQRANGGRIVAVGTTSVRALESATDADGRVQAGVASTEIFIRPGYKFRVVDALLTNFHLPRSSLLALVAAFAQDGAASENSRLTGLETVRYAYEQAVARRYRFFSWGDAMLIE